MGFVVEGFNDESKMKEVLPEALYVVTKGTRMNGRVKMDVDQVLKECDKLFLLTDPDDAGDKLAAMVLVHYPILRKSGFRQGRVLMSPEQQTQSRGRTLR